MVWPRGLSLLFIAACNLYKGGNRDKQVRTYRQSIHPSQGDLPHDWIMGGESGAYIREPFIIRTFHLGHIIGLIVYFNYTVMTFNIAISVDV